MDLAIRGPMGAAWDAMPQTISLVNISMMFPQIVDSLHFIGTAVAFGQGPGVSVLAYNDLTIIELPNHPTVS